MSLNLARLGKHQINFLIKMSNSTFCRGSSGSGFASVNRITLVDQLVQVVNPGKVPAGKTEIPFQLTLEVDKNNNNDNGTAASDAVKLFETYHGVKINVDYSIAAEIKRSGILASNVGTKGQEFFVEYEMSESPKWDARKYEFVMTPETVQKRNKKSLKNKSDTPMSDFRVRGQLISTTVRLSEPISGVLVVEQSERPIRSLELQLLRVESISSDDSNGPSNMHETSEVQNIQVHLPRTENTHLLCKRKYHCTTDLLFDWFGFGQTSKYLFFD